MSDDTRYPCCEHCPGIRYYVVSCEDNRWGHNDRCTVEGCPGSSPVGPTKEGKQ